MREAATLMIAWTAGLALGAFFFGGLWWTVRKGVSSPRPALWFLGSLLGRMGIVLPGFYLVSGHHWQRMLACLAGFSMARIAVNRITRPPPETRSSPEKRLRAAQEAMNAP